MNLKSIIRSLLCTSVWLAAPMTSAQAVVTEKLLLPISPGRVPGAQGSEWVTDLALTNMSDTTVSVDYGELYCPGLCVPVPVPPHSTIVAVDVLASSAVRGSFAVTEVGRTADLALTLRSRDLSRQSETWGTVIPVVSKNDLFSRRFGLVDVPIEPQFRAMLRIYDFNAETAANVRVRVYKLNPLQPGNQQPENDTPLLDLVPTFATPSPGEETLFPASFEFPLWLQPALSDAGRVRVQIDPLDDTGDYWAFVSVTHNDSQHVTVITP